MSSVIWDLVDVVKKLQDVRQIVQVDDVEGRIYFVDVLGVECQAVLDFEYDCLEMQWLDGSDWYCYDSFSFEQILEVKPNALRGLERA